MGGDHLLRDGQGASQIPPLRVVIRQRIKIVEVRGLGLDDRSQALFRLRQQTELLLENAGPELLRKIGSLVEESGARILSSGSPHTTLERFFLERTRETRGGRETKPKTEAEE